MPSSSQASSQAGRTLEAYPFEDWSNQFRVPRRWRRPGLPGDLIGPRARGAVALPPVLRRFRRQAGGVAGLPFDWVMKFGPVGPPSGLAPDGARPSEGGHGCHLSFVLGHAGRVRVPARVARRAAAAASAPSPVTTGPFRRPVRDGRDQLDHRPPPRLPANRRRPPARTA